MTDAGRESTRRYIIAMVAACPYPTSQGSQTLIRQLSETLVRRGHTVHLVCYHFGEEIPLTDDPGFRLHRISYPSFYRKFRAGPALQKPVLDLLLVWKLMHVVRRHDVDIIHAHNYEGLLVGLMARCSVKIPVVFHSHNAISDELHSFYNSARAKRIASWFAARIDLSVPRRADQIIALNEELVDFFSDRGVPHHRITLLPPGIELEDWSTEIHQQSEVMESGVIDRLARRTPVAVYAGNLDDYQNLPLMFRAFSEVHRTFPDSILVVVSRSDPAPSRRVVQELDLEDGVFFVRHDSFAVARAVFRQSRVALCPRTSWCGFPIKLLNYMASGLPVVACRGSAKAVEHRVTGLVVDNDDERAFSEAIGTLFTNRGMAEAMGKRGAGRIRAIHGWDAIVDRLEPVYNTVMDRGRLCH